MTSAFTSEILTTSTAPASTSDSLILTEILTERTLVYNNDGAQTSSRNTLSIPVILTIAAFVLLTVVFCSITCITCAYRHHRKQNKAKSYSPYAAVHGDYDESDYYVFGKYHVAACNISTWKI